jgi:hypothetical protein
MQMFLWPGELGQSGDESRIMMVKGKKEQNKTKKGWPRVTIAAEHENSVTVFHILPTSQFHCYRESSRCLVDFMDLQHTLESPANSTALVQEPIYHILTGSFRSLSLFLLAFSTKTRRLSHVETIPAFGPHQYLGTNLQKDRIYATSWALPPALSSWEVLRPPGETWSVKHINSVPISMSRLCKRQSSY